ncbi:MAG: hypothetical protein ACEQSU_13665, partial [Microgenomates group bacterium]
SFFVSDSIAKTPDGFFFQPAISIEYSAPALSNGNDKYFKSNNFSKQISGFDNIALGGNFRIHKFLGFNANWVQGSLNSNSLYNIFDTRLVTDDRPSMLIFTGFLFAPLFL